MSFIQKFLDSVKERMKKTLETYDVDSYLSGGPLVFYHVEEIDELSLTDFANIRVKSRKGKTVIEGVEFYYEIKSIGAGLKSIIIVSIRHLSKITTSAATTTYDGKTVKYSVTTNIHYVFNFRIDPKNKICAFSFTYFNPLLKEWNYLKLLDSIEKILKIKALALYESKIGFINFLKGKLDDLFEAFKKEIFIDMGVQI